MLFLSCPRCNVSIRIQSANLTMDHCPRCIAHARRLSPLHLAQTSDDAHRVNRAKSKHPGGGASGLTVES